MTCFHYVIYIICISIIHYDIQYIHNDMNVILIIGGEFLGVFAQDSEPFRNHNLRILTLSSAWFHTPGNSHDLHPQQATCSISALGMWYLYVSPAV